ncbi:zf-TFIIB domain-containing protein [Altericroceibacterium xinjiangense]|uniref:zf-TFIIB domain-containing protein n=1 Tax=Altericroceibacterium xinjiangense TaxID=762261 RepID=UPI000F7F58D6|nr:zf-TFIIB domain-containing protein [Altericroceibacterium xinjiangense]
MRTHDEVAGMQCPVCRVPLAMSDRQGIEIDYCPQCRGVWLDRGELDKIIERSAPQVQNTGAPQGAPAQNAPAQNAPAPQPSAPLHAGGGESPWAASAYTHGGVGHGYGHSGHGKPHKKRKSWLEEIFD